MTTITVPLNAQQIEHLDALVEDFGSSRAGVMRKALERMAEDEAIASILKSQQEYKEGKVLRGDLRTLLMDAQ
jgi:Arc/MetJ-type ribon-helix-helix transcriptional regulator